MAGNTRGKLKEHFEGIHRDFGWTRHHLTVSLELIKERKPGLSEAIRSLSEGIDMLDDLAQDIYSRL